ncbi:MAG: hypothetical protein LN568_06375 [Rickettsia endosymbiont of Pseudomimeciton antennatum]|nr:hypothetical protein [Rickettsia endosymbiont of Pseudomimeciton antennatum]
MSKRLKLSSHLLKLDFSTTSSLASFNKPEVKQENESLEEKPKLEQGTKSENMTLCFDWDGTMVEGSLDSELKNTFKEYNECVDTFLTDKKKGWKNKAQLVALLKEASELGYHIAIVSFGSYPKEIEYALTKLGLKQDTLEKFM